MSGLIDRLLGRSDITRLATILSDERRIINDTKDGTVTQREAAAERILQTRQSHNHLFLPAGSENRDLINDARRQFEPFIQNGAINIQFSGSQRLGQFSTEMVSHQNYPEIFRQTEEMNSELNQRYGSRLATPGVMIVDNPHQVPVYLAPADLIIIPRSMVVAGTASAMIAHELSERQGALIRGDFYLNNEIRVRDELNLPRREHAIAQHRANECREDADAIALVGPDAHQRAIVQLAGSLGHSADTNQLNDISANISTGGAIFYYPTYLDRHRMAATLRNHPELLEQFRQNPHAIRFDGSCTITQVEERRAVSPETVVESEQQGLRR